MPVFSRLSSSVCSLSASGRPKTISSSRCSKDCSQRCKTLRLRTWHNCQAQLSFWRLTQQASSRLLTQLHFKASVSSRCSRWHRDWTNFPRTVSFPISPGTLQSYTMKVCTLRSASIAIPQLYMWMMMQRVIKPIWSSRKIRLLQNGWSKCLNR